MRLHLVCWSGTTESLSEPNRVKVCNWYQVHGIDPNSVPADHYLDFDEESGTWKVQRYVVEGRALSMDGDVPRYWHSFTEIEPFPALDDDGVPARLPETLSELLEDMEPL